MDTKQFPPFAKSTRQFVMETKKGGRNLVKEMARDTTRPAKREWCSGWTRDFKIEKGVCGWTEKERATKESLKKES